MNARNETLPSAVRVDPFLVDVLSGPAVYIAIAKETQKVLYVGMSSCVGGRIFAGNHHVLGQFRGSYVLDICPCSDVQEASRLEKKLVRELSPLHNGEPFRGLAVSEVRTVRHEHYDTSPTGITCLACEAPLSGKQSEYCSTSCKADWHRRERIRMAEHLSITAAAIELGISRWKVRKAINDGRLRAVLVPTAGRPRCDITRGELERFLQKR